jgi:nucleolar MIF4G domain-containing protein 1
MSNSRNEMNECMLELLYAALLRKVTMPERVVLEHIMLVGVLHANIGTEIGMT